MRLPFATPALIVSCQARKDNPLHGSLFMAAMARAAEAGGAGAVRANGADDIAAIRAATRVPVIGISKIFDDRYPVYITPSLAAARAVAAADMIAVDATARRRDGEPVDELIRRITAELGKPVLADVANVDEARAAVAAGAAAVATTLSGYTTPGPPPTAPDLDLVARLAAMLPVPVIAEGRYADPADVARAFALGAAAVVVGTAITNPREITRRFAAVVPSKHAGGDGGSS
jgi:N-acylglucosamine-6-phosphate 2-epimerase